MEEGETPLAEEDTEVEGGDEGAFEGVLEEARSSAWLSAEAAVLSWHLTPASTCCV